MLQAKLHTSHSLSGFCCIEVAPAGDPGKERQAGGRDLELHLAKQGFSCLSLELRAVTFPPTHTEPIAPPLPCFPKKPIVGVGAATLLAKVNMPPQIHRLKSSPQNLRV